MESVGIEADEFIGEEQLQVVVFKLGIEEYAVEILYVQEIKKLLTITRVPRAEHYIEGVVNLRGNIIPVINLHTRFSLQSQGEDDDKRIIVFQIDDLRVGVIVDAVLEVLHMRKSEIDDATKLYESTNVDHIMGVIKKENRLFILLNLNKILE